MEDEPAEPQHQPQNKASKVRDKKELLLVLKLAFTKLISKLVRPEPQVCLHLTDFI